MREILLVASLLAAVPITSGCIECEPEPVDAEVDMQLVDEELRTLPVLTSGATSVGLPTDVDADVNAEPMENDVSTDTNVDQGEEVEVPDSHGYLDVEVNITHRIERVEVRELTLQVALEGRSLSVDVTNVAGGSDWQQTDADRWRGYAGNGSVLRLWWTLDEDEPQRLTGLADEEDSAYEATVTMRWETDSCSWEAQGTTERTFGDFVQTVADDASLAPAGEPEVEVNATSVGFEARYQVTSGLDLAIEDVSAAGVYTDASAPAGEARGVVFGTVAHNGTGEDDVLDPDEELRVYSAAGPDAGGGYEASGLLVPAPTQTPERVLLVVTVSYEPTDDTPGVQDQVFAHLVDPSE